MQRRALYDLDLSAETDRVLQFILRNYTGIFADYELISESFIASSLELTERTVYEALLRLRKMHVIDYVPRRRSPYIYMLRSRELRRDIILPKTVYEHRRQLMAERLDAMKRFVFDDYTCRVETMLEYFGEKTGRCGTCDVCRERNRLRATHRAAPPAVSGEILAEAILFVLNQNPEGISVWDLSVNLATPPERLYPVVRDLADTHKIKLADNILFLS